MAEVPPEHLRYTAEHEWIAVSGDTATIGVTAFAAEQLGDIVFVGLPAVGDAVTADSICGELESTKSVSDLYSPVGGTVSGINADVVDDPALVNAAPFAGGWLFRVASAEIPDGLMTSSEYVRLTEGGAA
jgi:glycine cleavage system H protein